LADLQRLFRNLPLHLGRKTIYSRLLPDATNTYARTLLDLLIKAQVATPCALTCYQPPYSTSKPPSPARTPIQSKPMIISIRYRSTPWKNFLNCSLPFEARGESRNQPVYRHESDL
jgi:hypothetical protein